jgi:hypothetical protein
MSVFLVASVLMVLVGPCVGQTRKIEVLEPLANAELTAGTTATVKWRSTGLQADAPITVAIYDARNWVKVFGVTVVDRADLLIASFSTRNSGSLEFVVPIVPEGKDTFYVSVSNAIDATVVDQSDKFRVKLSASSLTLTAPGAGARVLTGDPVTIKWTSVNISSSVTFDVRLKSAKTDVLSQWLPTSSEVDVAAVAYQQPNNGSFSWSMPLSVKPGDAYFLEMRWRGTQYRALSAQFSVAVGPRRLQVTQPSAALGWTLLKTQKTVAWTSTGFDSATRFNLVLFKVAADGAQTAVAELAKAVEGPRTYVSLPDDLTVGTYLVELGVAGQASLVASSEPFIVTADATSGVYVGEPKNNVDAPFFAGAAATALSSVALFGIVALHFH